MELVSIFFLKCALKEHFRRYAHAIRFIVGLHDTQNFHPIVKYEQYQISSGARASLVAAYAREFRLHGEIFKTNMLRFGVSFDQIVSTIEAFWFKF